MKLSDLNGDYMIVGTPEPKPTFADYGQKKLSDAQTQLASSQVVADKAFATPLTRIQSGNAGENVDVAKGALKQGLSDLSMAGAQNAGPVGAQMMADAKAKGGGAAKFAQGIDDFNTNMKPANLAEVQGAGMTSLGEAVIPVGSAKATGALSKLADSTGLTKFLGERAANKATSALQSTVDTMTKGERESAILEGRLKPKMTGGGDYVASETEKQAGKILAGKVTSDPIKNVPIIQSEIAKRGTEAEQFLGMNGKSISNEEDFDMFKSMKEKAAKYLTPEQIKNYDHTINQFQGELKGMGNMNTGTYYKALKNFEQNVTARLRQGNEALLTDSGSAQLQAAKDVRTAVRDMIGNKNPEFKGKMFDLASLYDALDNVVTKASKVDTFGKRHPVLSKALKYGAEAIGAGALYGTAKEVGAPLP